MQKHSRNGREEQRLLTIPEIEAIYARSEPIPPADPVYARMEFPFKRRFYPLGFPVDIVTNAEEVLEAAAQSWATFTEAFPTPPIRIQIGVMEGLSSECPPAPTCRVQQHLFSYVADQENFGMNDMARGFSCIWLTKAAVRHRSYLRHFFLDCAVFCQIATRCATGVHAACVIRNGIGVLLCGDSGAGKSTLSYACAKAGWTYVTDDLSFVIHDRDDRLVSGNCHQLRFRPSAGSIFPEIEGREITQRAEVGKPSIELGATALQNIDRSQTTKIKYVVFLNRREGNNAAIRPYSKEIARHFIGQGRFSPLDLMPRHYEAIDRLLKADVLELRYRDLDWAVEQLEALVETVHP